MTDQGLWFIREGANDDPLGKWEVWFRPVRAGERLHGHFPTRHQALTVVESLNELSRRGIQPDPGPHQEATQQADGDSGTTEVGEGFE